MEDEMLPSTMSTDELSALFGCSAETIRSMTRRHVLAKVGRGYPVAESTRRMMEHLRAMAAARGGKGADSVAANRARVLRLTGDKIEREAQQASGELVPADDFREIMEVVCRGLKTLFLQLPTRVGGAAPHLGRDDIELIAVEARAALTQVSELSLLQLKEIAEGVRELAP